MKNHLTLLKMSSLTLLGAMSLLLTVGQSSAANRIFPLYLKNGLSYAVTFKVVPGHCYQGTGSYDPRKLLHGPVAPGERVKFDVARDQDDDCEGADGVFFVKTTDPRHQAGNGQSFIFDNSGGLGMREGSEQFSGHLSAKSARDESYTWKIFEPVPAIEPKNNRLVRIQNVTSGQYLTQAHNGQRDDVRNVTVWPLPATKNNSFRWLMQDAGGGYWHLINLASGLALTWDGSGGQNVSDWGITDRNNPNQLWRFERRRNRYMIINKATNHGLQQAHNGIHPDKKNVHIWGGQTFAGNGWAWRLEDGGYADLVKLTVQTVKAIKTSTGQDIGTEILFGAIEAAISGGSSAAKEVGHKTLKLTVKEVVKEAGKEAGKSVLEAGSSALENHVKELSGANAREDALKDKLRNQNNALGTVGGIGLDAMDAIDDFEEATSLQNAFNVIYGESPDDLRIKVNGVSIWPNGGRDSRKIKSQQILPVYTQTIFERSKGLAVQLVEYDYGSGDDSLGWIGFTVKELTQTRWYERVLVRSDSEGSLYELTFTVGPIGMDAADIKNFEQQKIRLAEERERKIQQEEKNRLAQAETDRKMAQAAITPFSATLRILGSENGLSRIPLNRYSENPEKLLISPAIYLDVTFANGSTSNAYYHMQAPDNVIFDDTSGDPDDLIKLVYTPGPDGTEIPGQVTATGNGVGTAQLKVSFRNRPWLTASIAVEVVDTQPPVTQQATISPRAEFLNNWAARSRNGLSFPYTTDIFEVSQIYSRCPSGCEMVYPNEDILIVMGMPNHAQNDVTMEAVDNRVGVLFRAGYCRGEGKQANAILSFAISDKYGARIANTVFKPADCLADQAVPTQAPNHNANYAAYTPPSQTTTNNTAQFLNYIAEGSRAEISLPFTADVFKMTHIHSVCPSGCEHNNAESGLLVVLTMPEHEHNNVSEDEVLAQVRTVFGATYCQGELKKGHGRMIFSVNDRYGNNIVNTIFNPFDCGANTADSEPATNNALEGGKASSSSANDKYFGLLQTLNCPSDKNQYGAYADYGYWGGGAWCGQQGKAGYWVWVAPNWYIWGNQR